MLRKRSVIAWARQNTSVQVFPNHESLRYGQPLLQHLQKLFPFMRSVTTAAPHSTYLLPLFFNFVDELAQQTTAGEISRETSIFVCLLVVVALESVVTAQTPGRTVLVICYLNRVVEDLQSFFRYALPHVCRR